ncbi:ABC transporter substrate-binding protein [Xenophilus arseniciresistens]|uniref:ABC transporter substrate-binding protein n=1 Tax=Xenophilus arseniciresistens TaxID=1283306 RepID=A0AAE3NAX4_9BURK|nr:ABC transporter substrate-binding protein [Xenophilus arseniciresistens]MDA7418276.1 ABC transporter substrate-binding protein [Xenophilus arseniciresistens]
MTSPNNFPLLDAAGTRRRFVAGLALSGLGLPLARAADPLVIAQVAPFSGPQAVTGRAVHAGAKLHFEAVNARGGIKGRPIKFVTRDDAQKADQTIKLVREVIAQEAPIALLGTVGTTNLEALAKYGVLVQQRVAMMGAVSGASSIARAQGMHVVKASYHDEVARLFRNLSTMGVQRVGLVNQDDGLGQDVLVGAEAAARQFGIQLVANATYARNTTAVGPAVAQMVKAQPQAVFLGATTAAGIEFVKQYRAAGGAGAMLYGMSIIDTDALRKALGDDGARGYAFSVVLPLPSDQGRAVVRDYQALRNAAKDPDLSARSIEGFVAARALTQVIEGLGNPTAASVATALNAAKAVDVGGYTLDFSLGDQTASRYVDFAMFGAGGRIVQ